MPVMIRPIGPVAKRIAAPRRRVATAAAFDAAAPIFVAIVRARSATVARVVATVPPFLAAVS